MRSWRPSAIGWGRHTLRHDVTDAEKVRLVHRLSGDVQARIMQELGCLAALLAEVRMILAECRKG